ncbi:Nuclear LIM factor interactor-interacting protein hyphal form, partial [Phytophthora palmivora]
MADANDRKRKRQRRKNRKPKQLLPQQGHYADPLSPIASTPLKRQHTKAAENSKSAKAKHAADERERNEPKSKDEEKFFSPRKLVKEYDQQDEKKPRAKKARTLNYDSVNGEQEEKQEETTSATEDANDELFSPALKPPRATRSTSASPPNARGRLESKFATISAQPDEKVEEEEEAVDIGEEDQEDEDATPLEQEFNPFYFMKTL